MPNIIPLEKIENKILLIRRQKVMLDRDLALIYQVPTFRINEQVKRNIKRFPADFMFQLNKEEFNILKSHFAISSWGGTRKLPNVFTPFMVCVPVVSILFVVPSAILSAFVVSTS